MRPNQSLSHEQSKTVAFRVSVEDYNKIHMLVEISGMVKQDYLLARALDETITVYPNVRIQKYLEKYLIEIAQELKHLKLDDEISKEIIEKLRIVLNVISQM